MPIPHLVMNWRHQVIYDIVEGAFLYFVHQMIFTHCDRQMRQKRIKRREYDYRR